MAQGSMPAPKVPVITVQPQAVEIYSSYPGRTQAHREVQVRAQVGGILLSREYVEGERVQSGDLLFRIDPRPYEAAVSQARADLQNAQALLNQANRNWQRISSLFERGVASEKDRDDARSALEIAEAGLEVARARLQARLIDLDYTQVTAPIGGIVGLRAVSVGNLVNPGDLLTSITEVDPIQVQFTYSINDPFAQSPALRASAQNTAPAQILLSDGTVLNGIINYSDVRIDPSTDTIRARAIFENPNGVLRPNEFVRVRVKVETRDEVIVIPQTAIGSGPEPGSTVVWVVDEEQTVAVRYVELGPMTEAGLIVESGLAAGERIVTDGLVKLRPGIAIRPTDDTGTQAGEQP